MKILLFLLMSSVGIVKGVNITYLNTFRDIIVHPVSGGRYGLNENYYWQIEIPSSEWIITFYLQEIQIGRNHYIDIYDGYYPNGVLFQRYGFNAQTFNYAHSKGHAAYVNFRSDSIETGQGFKLAFYNNYPPNPPSTTTRSTTTTQWFSTPDAWVTSTKQDSTSGGSGNTPDSGAKTTFDPWATSGPGQTSHDSATSDNPIGTSEGSETTANPWATSGPVETQTEGGDSVTSEVPYGTAEGSATSVNPWAPDLASTVNPLPTGSSWGSEIDQASTSNPMDATTDHWVTDFAHTTFAAPDISKHPSASSENPWDASQTPGRLETDYTDPAGRTDDPWNTAKSDFYKTESVTQGDSLETSKNPQDSSQTPSRSDTTFGPQRTDYTELAGRTDDPWSTAKYQTDGATPGNSFETSNPAGVSTNDPQYNTEMSSRPGEVVSTWHPNYSDSPVVSTNDFGTSPNGPTIHPWGTEGDVKTSPPSLSTTIAPTSTAASTTTKSTTTTTRSTTTTTPGGSTPSDEWPIWDDTLGFWPLDINYGLYNIAPRGASCVQCRGELREKPTGPFGHVATSHGTKNADILDVPKLRPPGNQSMTLTFFIHTPNSNVQSGLISLTDGSGGNYLQLDVSSNVGSLVLRGSNNEALGSFEVLRPGDWTFVAIILENSAWSPCMLSLQNNLGVTYAPVHLVKFCDSLKKMTDLSLGQTRSGGFLAKDAAISCLAVFNKALSHSEVKKVHDTCRNSHGAAACGSPIVPYPPIPLSTSTTPKYGQFPWIVSIRRRSSVNTVVCSGALIDPYFVITSASCVASVKPADLQIRVGDLDAIIEEKFERQHAIVHTYPHSTYDNISLGDIALVELATPVDLDNAYVNTICLPDDPYQFQTRSQSQYFFFGWGSNGRSAFLSQSLPRYVTGEMLSDSACAAAWPQDYRPKLNVCFKSAQNNPQNVPCSHDEGGVLMAAGTDAMGNTNLKPVALYSKRSADCSSKPALFTSLAPYMSWLAKVTACTLPGFKYNLNCPL